MNTLFGNANHGDSGKESTSFVQAALASLTPEMLDIGNVTRWLLEQLHPSGPACPECGISITSRFGLQNWYDLKRVKCQNCGNHSTAAAGTILASTPLDVRQIYMMAILIGAGVDRRKIASMFNTRLQTVQAWDDRFSKAAGRALVHACQQGAVG